MAFELLGPNLEDVFNDCGRKLSQTVLMFVDQLISTFTPKGSFIETSSLTIYWYATGNKDTTSM